MAYPKLLMNITQNGTIITYNITSIDYKYPLEYFHVDNMIASVYSYVTAENGTLEYGDYYYKGHLSDLLNNDTIPLIYYDVNNDATLSVSDYFVSDLNSLSEPNLSWIQFTLWIVDAGQEIRCMG